MNEYNDFQYLWPPRPETKIAKTMLGFYQTRGYMAQKKKNGTCTVIFSCGDKVLFKTRHGDENDGNHKLWTPQDDHIKFFQGREKWNVYVAELLHSKTPTVKNQLYIFDIIVDEGEQLVDTTFEERQLLLQSRWTGDYEPLKHQTRVHEYVSVAENLTGDFDSIYDNLQPEDEGLVLKNPTAKLKACLKPDSNAPWQVKCRVTTKNYSF